MSPRTAATSRGPTHKFAQFLQPLKVCSNRADRNSNLFIERTRPLRQTGGGRVGWDSHLSCFVVSVTNNMSSETCHEAKSQTSLDPLICISWHIHISTCRCYLHNCTTGEVIQQYPAACWLQVACAVFRADYCCVQCGEAVVAVTGGQHQDNCNMLGWAAARGIYNKNYCQANKESILQPTSCNAAVGSVGYAPVTAVGIDPSLPNVIAREYTWII